MNYQKEAADMTILRIIRDKLEKGITMTRINKRKNSSINYILIIVAIVVVLTVLIICRENLEEIMDKLNQGTTTDIVEVIRSWGVWAPIISILLMVLQAFVAPIPSFLITGANGVVFGVTGGIIISWIGAMIGAIGTFYLARLLGERFVRRFENNSGLLAKVDEISENQGSKIIFIARLLPFVSFDFISYAAGLSTIKSWHFFIATGFGMIPGTIGYVLLGNEFYKYSDVLGKCIWLVVIGYLLYWMIRKVVQISRSLIDRRKCIMNSMEMKTLLLVGGGHAHLYLLKQLITNPIKDYKVILISMGNRQYYSGMASAFMEDIYTEEDFSVDLIKMCKLSNVKFIKDEVISIDPKNKSILTRSQETYEFDLISFDTGSKVINEQLEGALEFAECVKPLEHLSQIKKQLKEIKKENYHIVIVGGGASGVELALSLCNYGLRLGKKFKIIILNSRKNILKGYSKKLKTNVQKVLKKNGIRVINEEYVKRIAVNKVILKSKKALSCDFVLIATGSLSHTLYAASGLKVDDKGYMKVNTYLQNIEYPFIFGAGDCISFDEYNYVNKVGVYAIREAPILWDNINLMVQNKPLDKYVPQKNYLSIISLGNKKGILSYYGFIFTGSLPWLLKNWIDLKFIRQFQK